MVVYLNGKLQILSISDLQKSKYPNIQISKSLNIQISKSLNIQKPNDKLFLCLPLQTFLVPNVEASKKLGLLAFPYTF